MNTALLQIRIDEDLKKEASSLFEQLGLDISSAVRMFLKRAVLESGIPFNLNIPDNAENIRIKREFKYDTRRN